MVKAVDEILDENQKTMPRFEQFDLCDTFINTVFDKVCQIPASKFKAFQAEIMKALKDACYSYQSTYLTQKELSEKLYSILS